MEDVILKLNDNHLDYASNISVKKLVELLSYLKNIYYNSPKNEILVSDNIFDDLEEILKKKSPNNKYFNQVGTPIKDKIKVELPERMPSLDKFKDEKSINRFLTKYSGPFILSDKLDGVSAMFYQNKLYTRGDGNYGTDISNYIKELKIKIPPELMVRGEIIIPKKYHKNFNSNSRNIVSGYLNAKTIDKDLSKFIEFIGYQIIDSELIPEEQFKIFRELKINHCNYTKKNNINLKILQEYLKLRKVNSKYDIDGIVIYNNQEYKIPKLRNPKYAFAFKMDFDEQKVNTEVLDVEYNASKDGLLIPRLLVNTVKIGNVNISKVTGHNGRFIINNKIGPGTIIELIRSGDVIPKVNNIIKSSKEGKKPNCKYKWNSTEVHFVIDGVDENNQVLAKNILNFITKMKINNINIGLVKKFINSDLDTLNKILIAKESDFLKIEGIKETMAKKLYQNIQDKIKNSKLSQVMVGSNMFGAGLGERKLKLITDKYPDILKIKGDIYNKIIEIDGFSDKSTKQFIDNLENFKEFLKIHKTIKIIEEETKIYVGNKFKDDIIVFSGFRNDDLKNKIENNGGKVTTTITNNSTKLIVKELNNSSKIQKAQELGIPIILYEEFT